MKKLTALFMVLIFSGTTYCLSQNKDVSENMKYPIEITDNIKKIKDIGWGYRFWLKKAQTIKKFPVKKGIMIAYDGSKMIFMLAEDHFINGDTIPESSKLRMYTEAKPFAYDLSEPTLIQGYWVGTEKIYGNGSNVDFYEENCKINWFMPEKNIKINGIPCLAKHTIKLYPTGDLHICTLSEDYNYKGKIYKANTNIIFDKNRKVSTVSKYNLGIQQLPWRINFYDDGNPSDLYFRSSQDINGLSASTVYFHPDGKVSSCKLSKSTTIDGIQYKKGTSISFDENGKIKKQDDWGVIGTATPGGWNSDQDMTYNTVTMQWSISLSLKVGEIKFRANDNWGLNFGDDEADRLLDQDGANIKIDKAGEYTIYLDLIRNSYSIIAK